MPKQLEKKQMGARLSASNDWNALVDIVNADVIVHPTTSLGGTAVCYTEQSLPSYSLFTIVEASIDEPLHVGMKSDGSPVPDEGPFFTNGEIAVPGGSYFHASPIGMSDVVKIVTSTNGDLPVPGEMCGPDPTDYGMAWGRKGFVCLAVSDDEAHARVIRIMPREPKVVMLDGDMVPGGSDVSAFLLKFDGSPDVDNPVLVNDVPLPGGQCRALGRTTMGITKGGAIGYAMPRPAPTGWYFLPLTQQARRIRGKLHAAITATTDTIQIDDPIATDGGQVKPGTLMAKNVRTSKGFTGPSGGIARAELNVGTGDYELYDVECP